MGLIIGSGSVFNRPGGGGGSDPALNERLERILDGYFGEIPEVQNMFKNAQVPQAEDWSILPSPLPANSYVKFSEQMEDEFGIIDVHSYGTSTYKLFQSIEIKSGEAYKIEFYAKVVEFSGGLLTKGVTLAILPLQSGVALEDVSIKIDGEPIAGSKAFTSTTGWVKVEYTFKRPSANSDYTAQCGVSVKNLNTSASAFGLMKFKDFIMTKIN